jgi:hypothetical protein
VGSESVSGVERQWSRAFERRWMGRKEDLGVAGKVDDVGDDRAVCGGEGNSSNEGVGGKDGGAGSA